ncbi:hypothetical protein NPIL_236501 [Nephila pilipes]|uniref:Uncharacterized protein n=1 Tax=Nephila pilipes TaxID=299642 RepID=A0A8X6TC26_NEPPI|nr:hypothetical protein NPIL_236501 [Nephila pilipes]
MTGPELLARSHPTHSPFFSLSSIVVCHGSGYRHSGQVHMPQHVLRRQTMHIGTRGHTVVLVTPSFASRWDRVRPWKTEEASLEAYTDPAAFDPTLSTDQGLGPCPSSKQGG